MARAYEQACIGASRAASVSGLILWLKEQKDGELDSLPDARVDAVKLMTHHAAKGLEWPVVILMDLQASTRDRLWSISALSRHGISATAPLQDRFIRYWPWPFGDQKKCTLADDIGNTALAQTFRLAAVAENKRLLYVSMTRARDLLILCRSSRKPTGEWIDSLNAPWLLPDAGAVVLTLPSGSPIEAERLDLFPDALADLPLPVQAGPVMWYPPQDQTVARIPLSFNPSTARSVACEVAEHQAVGKRIELSGALGMDVLGTAIHACIALSFTDCTVALDVDEVHRILAGYGVEKNVGAHAVLAQVEAFHRFIKTRWTGAVPRAEILVQSAMASGQVLAGRIDLLLELPAGWILFDHKANPQARTQWAAIATKHSGQLAAYSEAIALASGKPVLESWLFFPVSAGAVRVAFA